VGYISWVISAESQRMSPRGEEVRKKENERKNAPI
jgi:hypothetical protein